MLVETHWITNYKAVQSVMAAMAIFLILVENIFSSNVNEPITYFSADEILIQWAFMIGGTIVLCLFELNAANSAFPRVAHLLNAEERQRASRVFDSIYWGCVKLFLLTVFLQAVCLMYLLFSRPQSDIGTLCALSLSVACFGLFGTHVYAKVRAFNKFETLLNERLLKTREERRKAKERLTGSL